MFAKSESKSEMSRNQNRNQNRNQPRKFVEATVSQLARVLYDLHTDYGSQPVTAIEMAIDTFGDDVERNTILQAARGSAEMMMRKQKALMHGAKSKSTMTVFEQAQQMKEQSLSKLKSEMLEAWNAAQEPGISTAANQDFLETYEQIQAYRWQLKQDLRQADYTEEELTAATLRLEKIQRIEDRGGNSSESVIPLMKEIWLQLVKTLLLLKSNKAAGSEPSTFENTPLASKEPIAIIARGETAKLSRLVMEDGEMIRVFAARCKSELRFCNWLRELHAPGPSRSNALAAQNSLLAKQIDNDIDTQLFTAPSPLVYRSD